MAMMTAATSNAALAMVIVVCAVAIIQGSMAVASYKDLSGCTDDAGAENAKAMYHAQIGILVVAVVFAVAAAGLAGFTWHQGRIKAAKVAAMEAL